MEQMSEQKKTLLLFQKELGNLQLLLNKRLEDCMNAQDLSFTVQDFPMKLDETMSYIAAIAAQTPVVPVPVTGGVTDNQMKIPVQPPPLAEKRDDQLWCDLLTLSGTRILRRVLARFADDSLLPGRSRESATRATRCYPALRADRLDEDLVPGRGGDAAGADRPARLLLAGAREQQMPPDVLGSRGPEDFQEETPLRVQAPEGPWRQRPTRVRHHFLGPI